ncbi:MAG TPA: hypothetical protein VMU43_11300 [Candidatus Acidoferrum sp.]|nr:hypothetical protein [Candidatus Acidoferrum sp.]
MDKTRIRTYVLAGLLVFTLLLYFYFREPSSVGNSVVAADQKFEPLDVREPDLRLDLLEKLHKLKYEGTHRNIFSAIAPPPPAAASAPVHEVQRPVGPMPPPPPPPVQFPGQFFGTEMTPSTGTKLAFFQQGQDVSVIGEGGVIFGNFRLLHIGDDSVTVEEISTGRTTTVPMQTQSDHGPAAAPAPEDDRPNDE